MKKYLVIIFSVIMMFYIVACDAGLRYVSMEIISEPYNCVYPVNYSGDIDFNGGKVLLKTADGHTNEVDMSEYHVLCDERGDFGFSTNVDFQSPGCYLVTLHQCQGLESTFEIVVKDFP